ncbi:WGxxGxxG family protein [Saccharothrix yanglingensis]|uniref:MYXO-CTERM domain-containing protein n=1 Tax=Saccharothrix yanglingensis TaxID=659496 RepID=A0ABU0XCW3_9PSEU|nr:WGxxGxxG family protein [Saccharothrix yanglingensis]MDQ2589064.1 hypothetical protein [Saccharothrix yanglingensis]
MGNIKYFIAALAVGAALTAVPTAAASADAIEPHTTVVLMGQDDDNNTDDDSGNWGLWGLLGLLGLAGLAGRKKHDVTDRHTTGR